MKLLKKLLKLLTILSLLFLTISCNEEMSKFLFVIDNSENVEWKQDEFINPIKDFFSSKFNNKISFSTVTENGSFDKVIIDNSYNLSKVIDKDPKILGFVMSIKPYLNRKLNTIQYRVTLSTTLTKFEEVVSEKGEDKSLNTIVYQKANNVDMSSDAISDSKKIISSINDKFQNKNSSQIFSESDKFFVWGKELETKLIVLNDVKQNIKWDYEGYIKEIETIVNQNIPKRKFITEKIDIESSIGSMERKQSDYIEESLKSDDIDFCVITYIRPYINTDFKNMEFEFLLATSKNYKEKFLYNDDKILDVLQILDLIKKKIANNDLNSLSSPMIWHQLNGIKTTHLTYKTYNQIIKTDGMYIMIDQIADILKNGKFNFDDILVGNEFKPEKSDKCKDIINFFNSKKLSNIFFDQNGNDTNKKLIFFEFLRTGGKDIRLLFGPIEERDFNILVKKFEEKNIKVFPNVVFPYDFR